MKKILYMLLCLFLLVGCTHQTGDNTGTSSTTSTDPEIIIDLNNAVFTCYEWEEKQYDPRIYFKSNESSGRTPHVVFIFSENSQLKISGHIGTTTFEKYKGTYKNIENNSYEYNVEFICTDEYKCELYSNEKDKNITGYFSIIDNEFYYDNDSNKKCTYEYPNYPR